MRSFICSLVCARWKFDADARRCQVSTDITVSFFLATTNSNTNPLKMFHLNFKQNYYLKTVLDLISRHVCKVRCERDSKRVCMWRWQRSRTPAKIELKIQTKEISKWSDDERKKCSRRNGVAAISYIPYFEMTFDWHSCPRHPFCGRHWNRLISSR